LNYWDVGLKLLKKFEGRQLYRGESKMSSGNFWGWELFMRGFDGMGWLLLGLLYGNEVYGIIGRVGLE
jgi:hypothetical protein